MGQGSLALLDYRRRVAAHYAQVRDGPGTPQERWQQWRQRRDHLFRTHSESALTEAHRRAFSGLRYFDYDPDLRFEQELTPATSQDQLEVELAQDGAVGMQALGTCQISVAGEAATLTVYWLQGYGGGLFLPFRDATNGEDTYGGGRYLLDSIKGADLGSVEDRLILDFNFAYNPSCAYNPQWHCPLAPADNWLEIPIDAGELDFHPEGSAEPDPSAIPQPR